MSKYNHLSLLCRKLIYEFSYAVVHLTFDHRGFHVVIMGKDYHKELYEHIQLMAKNESISEEDMNLLYITDSVDEMVTHIQTHAIKRFNLVKMQQKPKWWFGEWGRKPSTAS